MPQKPDKQCSVPGCPELVPSGQAKCNTHRAQDNRQYEQQRDRSIKKKYSEKEWRALRKLKLEQQPCCERCLKEGRVEPAELVHHKDPVQEGGAFLPELQDLEALCKKCHNKEHKRGAVKGKNT